MSWVVVERGETEVVRERDENPDDAVAMVDDQDVGI